MLNSCSKCSVSLDEDAVFCPSCATPVNPECPNCQKHITNEAKFCKYCAYDLTKTKSSNPPNSLSSLPKENSPQLKQNPLQNVSDEQLDKLASLGLKISGVSMVLSAVLFLWGRSYVNNFSNTLQAGAYQLVGQTDSTYAFAQNATIWGVVIFFIGIIIMCICGMWLWVKKMM